MDGLSHMKKNWRVPCTRTVETKLRTARLRAARKYALGSVPRHAILGGYWDRGSVVRDCMDPSS